MQTTLTLALKRQMFRKRWTPSEDLKLKELVAIYGPRKWKHIAEQMQGRTDKTCRSRWYRYLDPNINKRPFSEEEEAILVKSHNEFGNKWSLIAKSFVGRSDDALKCQWHKILRRQRKNSGCHHHLALLTPHVSISQPSPSSSLPLSALPSSEAVDAIEDESVNTNIPPKLIDFLGVGDQSQ